MIQIKKYFWCFVVLFLFITPAYAEIVNDVTKLNPIEVQKVIAPKTIQQIQQIIKSSQGPISIGGGRYSMGGQTATEKALFIDMREMNKVVSFSQKDKKITVQAGATWRDIQSYIDPYDLSVRIMQTYNNFTVGGALSVNAHGRYIGEGPIIKSVQSIKIVLADGRLVTASSTNNADIFYGAIGGYGALGVIVEATLHLTTNDVIGRKNEEMPVAAYKNYFLENILTRKESVFHNADIYPPDFNSVNAVTWYKTQKELTITDRLKPKKDNYFLEKVALYWITELPLGHWVRQHLIDSYRYRDHPIVMRNYEASYDVQELEPSSRESSTYVLQEYFVPVQNFDKFVPKMVDILRKSDVNVVNISIRHAGKDPGSILAWAREDVFSFVLYYKQGVTQQDKEKVGEWTRKLIDAVISVQGTYYLPYQPHATKAQFLRTYPNAQKFFQLKKKLDPTYKFRNKLWDKYYKS